MFQIIILVCTIIAGIAMILAGIKAFKSPKWYMRAMAWSLILIGTAFIMIVYIIVDKMIGGLTHG